MKVVGKESHIWGHIKNQFSKAFPLQYLSHRTETMNHFKLLLFQTRNTFFYFSFKVLVGICWSNSDWNGKSTGSISTYKGKFNLYTFLSISYIAVLKTNSQASHPPVIFFPIHFVTQSFNSLAPFNFSPHVKYS